MSIEEIVLQNRTLRFKRRNGKLFVPEDLFVIRRSKEEGEKDLRRLVEEEEREASWFYSTDDSKWYSLTVETRTIRDLVSRRPLHVGVETHVVDCSVIGNTVSNYHTHPRFVVRSEIEWAISKVEKLSNYPKDHSEQNNVKNGVSSSTAVHMALPGVYDMGSNQKYFAFSPECDLDFNVISPFGKSTVKFTGSEEEIKRMLGEYSKLCNWLMLMKISNRALDKAMDFYGQIGIPKSIDKALQELNTRLTPTAHFSFQHAQNPFFYR